MSNIFIALIVAGTDQEKYEEYFARYLAPLGLAKVPFHIKLKGPSHLARLPLTEVLQKVEKVAAQTPAFEVIVCEPGLINGSTLLHRRVTSPGLQQLRTDILAALDLQPDTLELYAELANIAGRGDADPTALLSGADFYFSTRTIFHATEVSIFLQESPAHTYQPWHRYPLRR